MGSVLTDCFSSSQRQAGKHIFLDKRYRLTFNLTSAQQWDEALATGHDDERMIAVSEIPL